MAPLVRASKRPLVSSIAGWIRSLGLDNLVAGNSYSGRMETRIVNRTGSTVVLRKKYRDIWEEARFRLRQGESVVVRWAPEKPYETLGAFVESTGLQQQLLQPTVPLLLIGQSAIARNQEIMLSCSKSGSHHHEITMVGREASK